MMNPSGDPEGGRSFLTRAGVSALNLFVPGLGLLRLGSWREAAFFFLAPFVLIALGDFGMGHFPITSYDRALIALAILLSLVAALYVVPVVLTWRESRFRSFVRWWSRWYSLTAVAIILLSLGQLAVPLMHNFYKPYYAPSESMAPTIDKDDKFIADMRWRGPFRRGQIVIFNGPSGARIYRIAAIPGDRIEMRGGLPILNGEAALQSPSGRIVFAGYDGLHSAAMLTERLPGEATDHRVLNTGPSSLDDMKEAVVPPNHLFLLGDNRDNSADSRVPSDLGGVGMVPYSAILGRPIYIHWSSDHSRIGTRLDS